MLYDQEVNPQEQVMMESNYDNLVVGWWPIDPG